MVVGSVGRLVADKDFPLLVEALAPLLDARERLYLILVGEGPARSLIEEAIGRFVSPAARRRVVLIGQRLDVPRVLCAFDLFASSSRTEGLPLALPEAMASGLPVVATAVGGVPGIVSGNSGVLVAPGDPAALRGAIARFLDDDTERARVGASARAYAIDRFAEARMIDAYLRLYAGCPA
jgi:glycosyltransferase involved in cell wall biosynthesis